MTTRLEFEWLELEYTQEMKIWCVKNKNIHVSWNTNPTKLPDGNIEFRHYVKCIDFEVDEDVAAFKLKFGL